MNKQIADLEGASEIVGRMKERSEILDLILMMQQELQNTINDNEKYITSKIMRISIEMIMDIIRDRKILIP